MKKLLFLFSLLSFTITSIFSTNWLFLAARSGAARTPRVLIRSFSSQKFKRSEDRTPKEMKEMLDEAKKNSDERRKAEKKALDLFFNDPKANSEDPFIQELLNQRRKLLQEKKEALGVLMGLINPSYWSIMKCFNLSCMYCKSATILLQAALCYPKEIRDFAREVRIEIREMRKAHSEYKK